ncbi:hypothetical protein KY385_00560 [Candidatus Parcubacteria bacterium]|nr:hypothetical protein [Candidatus Parcubacteria bacterium]
MSDKGNDDQVAELLKQMLSDDDNEGNVRHISFNDSPGAPSNVFHVSTLPKNHPLYIRNHGNEIVEEGEEGLFYRSDEPALHAPGDKVTISKGGANEYKLES